MKYMMIATDKKGMNGYMKLMHCIFFSYNY